MEELQLSQPDNKNAVMSYLSNSIKFSNYFKLNIVLQLFSRNIIICA